ncbi:hypothetical protein YT1_4409 [Rhodococcus ruber]|nr:hypothetical protein YT1_4409 [Rhodococcus ruber]
MNVVIGHDVVSPIRDLRPWCGGDPPVRPDPLMRTPVRAPDRGGSRPPWAGDRPFVA